MTWFPRLRINRSQPLDSRLLRLGRYTDSYKTVDQYKAWERAIRYFGEQKWEKSFQHILYYLHDPIEQNLHWVADREGSFSFELFQGSRRISGILGKDGCEVVTTVGRVSDLPEELMLTLLHTNYHLRFSFYALEDDGRIVLRFSFPAREADPFKMVAALKELALEADHRDDRLSDKFSDIKPIFEPHIREKPEGEVILRIQWFRDQIKALTEWYIRDKAQHELFPGGFCYALLANIYKIEFLLSPQGKLKEAVEQMHVSYFNHADGGQMSRIAVLMDHLEQLAALPDSELKADFYDVTTTFGTVEPLPVDRLRQILLAEIDQIDSYHKKALNEYASAIPAYIIGYCLYRYAIPGLIRDLFALYYFLTEPEFMQALEYPILGKGRKDGFDKRAIQRTIRHLEGEWADRLQISGLDAHVLDFEDDISFGRSFLLMVAHAKVEEL